VVDRGIDCFVRTGFAAAEELILTALFCPHRT
jgi:hypothetical protein